MSNLAYEDAAHLAARAADALATTRLDEPDLAAKVQLLQGEASRTLGRIREARASIDRAAEIARAHGFTDILGRAGLAAAAATTAGIGFEFGVVDEPLARLLEEALALEADVPRRIRLLSALAITLNYDPDRARREALSAEAVACAEGAEDDRLLAAALLARATMLWTASTMLEREATLERAVAHAVRANDPDLEVRIRVGLFTTHFELGRPDIAEQQLIDLDRLAQRLRQPGYYFFPASLRVLLDLLRGNYDEVEVAIEFVHSMTHAVYGVNAGLVYEARRYLLSRDRKPPRPVPPEAKANLDGSVLTVRRLAITQRLAITGDPDSRRLYEEGMDLRLLDDALWLSAMTTKCELAWGFGDGARAGALLDQLRPYAGRLVTNGTAISTGGVSRYLGLAAHAAGDHDEANHWFTRAAEEHERWSARPWLARTWADHSRLLHDRGEPGDADRALELEAAARRLAAEIGLRDPFTPRWG